MKLTARKLANILVAFYVIDVSTQTKGPCKAWKQIDVTHAECSEQSILPPVHSLTADGNEIFNCVEVSTSNKTCTWLDDLTTQLNRVHKESK